MTSRFAQLAFTPGVQAQQQAHGSDRAYRRMLEGPQAADRLGPDERWFIGERESFYLGTVSETGWPYIQHRGGPPGFLKVLDDATLGFADFRGNRQYISTGNLGHDPRVSLFLMDYARRSRLKILGRARAVEGDAGLLSELTVPGYKATAERAIVIDVEAYDWNCPQHIPALYPVDAVRETITQLHDRIADLERENARLRATA
ncbi:pyridoxamine 5'-phosphate oxidase family protein [Longispora albida]|uniref:pyridoxamine 5'-phosphate oxidase family protein n=1 Tax=Longispora albida TaxID=203523 RepID=UPI00036C6859|nr:pyridoxamine 5'-phosphate oxidase family protein [Longispora albida]